MNRKNGHDCTLEILDARMRWERDFVQNLRCESTIVPGFFHDKSFDGGAYWAPCAECAQEWYAGELLILPGIKHDNNSAQQFPKYFRRFDVRRIFQFNVLRMTCDAFPWGEDGKFGWGCTG